MNSSSLLSVQNLSVAFGNTHVVDGISFSVNRGEFFFLVGENGSGKSVSALSILKLLPYPQASHPSGEVVFDGQNLMEMEEKGMRQLRGSRISMIFQEPLSALNPLHTVRKQIGEMLELHQGLREREVEAKCIELLQQVGIEEAKEKLDAYPHQLSGGQRQRVMIAMALANDPELLIADEPTTALDVTVARQVMDLLNRIRQERNLAILFITHDLGLVRHYGDRVAVMQAGKIIEEGKTNELFEHPQHAYTKELMSYGKVSSPIPLRPSETILKARDVKVWVNEAGSGWFKKKQKVILDAVRFQLQAGESLGIVGESGSGKSTLALALLKLMESSGEVWLGGERIDILNEKRFRPYRKKIQVVFQDPFSSLSPRMPVVDIVGEGLVIHSTISREKLETRVAHVLQEVGLDAEMMYRYPHEFSGGQRQRIAIARALLLKPQVLILDEPTSALDRAVQHQVVELLKKLQRDHGLAYLFISHDLSVVRSLCHQVLVLKDGKVVEEGPTEEVYRQPRQAYTKNLIESAFVE